MRTNRRRLRGEGGHSITSSLRSSRMAMASVYETKRELDDAWRVLTRRTDDPSERRAVDVGGRVVDLNAVVHVVGFEPERHPLARLPQRKILVQAEVDVLDALPEEGVARHDRLDGVTKCRGTEGRERQLLIRSRDVVHRSAEQAPIENHRPGFG